MGGQITYRHNAPCILIDTDQQNSVVIINTTCIQFTMDIQDLRRILESANQQVNVLDIYLHNLVEQCEQLSMDPQTDFTYLTFKMTIMSEIKKLYEHYRDVKQEQFQQQCSTELTQIILSPPSSPDHLYHHDSLPVPDSPLSHSSDWDIEVDIHQVPSMLSPIDDPVIGVDFNTSFGVTDFMSDMATDQLRDM